MCYAHFNKDMHYICLDFTRCKISTNIMRRITETAITKLSENNVTYVKVILHQFWVKKISP
jgi:hypothetical protein